jgi:hypothetical protein
LLSVFLVRFRAPLISLLRSKMLTDLRARARDAGDDDEMGVAVVSTTSYHTRRPPHHGNPSPIMGRRSQTFIMLMATAMHIHQRGRRQETRTHARQVRQDCFNL